MLRGFLFYAQDHRGNDEIRIADDAGMMNDEGWNAISSILFLIL
jgi:hypothetical protein